MGKIWEWTGHGTFPSERTLKDKNAYGPSLATVEDIVIEPCESGGTSTKHVTSLGMSKATHEFLTLHYFALDSAEWWEQILGELLPNAQFPAAVIRRTIAYQMFMAAHIAPSHRRPPHPVWEDSLSLIADLLFGNGMDRYVGAMQRADSPLEVNVRGFSAGSYSGLAFLHILWPIPRVTTKGCLGAIACPPSLLSMSRAKREDRLHLIHYESDSLCSWKPGLQQLQGCCTSFTYITNEITSYKGHFGPDEHDYSHWMALELPHGSYALRVLLFIRPAAASKARRDATPLRLISWLSYKLNPELEQFIEKAMEHLSTWTETEGGKVLTMGKEAIPKGETVNTEVELRNQLIDLISVGNLKHKPQALFTLFRQFLTRISLPRLIHFMDLVLPQLTPVQAAWAGEEKTLWSCHYIRWLREWQSDATPRVQISYVFSSHDNVHHVRIQWNSNPLLLFTDPTMVEALPVEHFSQQASHMTHQQHLQMGLRKGMAMKSPVGSKSGTSRPRVSILSWLQMQELIGLPWMMMTSQRSFPSCSKVSCRMCFHNGQPLRGKVPNHKNLRCQCSSRDQLCGRMARLITIQTPILAYTNHTACLSCPGEC